MKKILIILMAISLAGCAGPNPFTVISAASGYTITQNELDGARNSYDGTFLATLKSYAVLPRCLKGTGFSLTNRCHDRTLLKKMRNADSAVATAFNSTQDQLTSGNNSGALAAYMTLQTAIAAAKKILTDNNLIGL